VGSFEGKLIGSMLGESDKTLVRFEVGGIVDLAVGVKEGIVLGSNDE